MPYKAKILGEKCPYSELFWPVFSAFGLNAKRHAKIRTRITLNTDTFYAVKTGIAYHMSNTFRHILF